MHTLQAKDVPIFTWLSEAIGVNIFAKSNVLSIGFELSTSKPIVQHSTTYCTT